MGSEAELVEANEPEVDLVDEALDGIVEELEAAAEAEGGNDGEDADTDNSDTADESGQDGEADDTAGADGSDSEDEEEEPELDPEAGPIPYPAFKKRIDKFKGKIEAKETEIQELTEKLEKAAPSPEEQAKVKRYEEFGVGLENVINREPWMDTFLFQLFKGQEPDWANVAQIAQAKATGTYQAPAAPEQPQSDPELEELKQWKVQQEARQAQTEFKTKFAEDVTNMQSSWKDKGETLSKEDVAELKALAAGELAASPRNADGTYQSLPSIQKIGERMLKKRLNIKEAVLKKQVEKAPRKKAIPPNLRGGAAGDEVPEAPDINSPDYDKWMVDNIDYLTTPDE